MKNAKNGTKSSDSWVHDTRSGEMPDPNRKLAEKASDAAAVFKLQPQTKEQKVKNDKGLEKHLSSHSKK